MTDAQVKQLFSMQRDATIGVRAGRVVFLNTVAESLFPDIKPGEDAFEILPAAILEMEEESFSTSVPVGEHMYTILGTQMEGMGIYTLIPQGSGEATPSGQLLERVCDTMRRSLTVLNMANEFIVPTLNQGGAPVPEASVMAITKAYYQLQRLCDNLDHFARLGEGQAQLLLEQLDLVSFCRDLVQSLDHFAKRLSQRVHFHTDHRQIPATVDRQKMTKLLLNLVSNSLKNLGEGGSISLELSTQGDDAVLTLRDTGSGIAPSHMAEVFTRYQGLRSDTDTQAGVGLGMHIAQGLARLHGGTLLVTSQEGQGATIRLRIPTRQSADAGYLEEAVLPYGEGDGGMHLILTELSDVLDDEVFLGRYY